MAELRIAPVTRMVRNVGAESGNENAINLHGSLHSSDTVPYPIIFPFEWRYGEKVIATIEKLSADELTEVAEKKNGQKHNPMCAICGEQKELGYRKESGNVSHLICEACATHYVRKARALKSQE